MQANLLQTIDNRDEKADIWNTFVVQVPHPLHQLWRRRYYGTEGFNQRSKLASPSFTSIDLPFALQQDVNPVFPVMH